jgi:hypothetical protein
VSITRKSAAAAAVLFAVVSAGASGASAATLSDYYRTSMVIRACDLNVTRQQATGVSRAIEQKVAQVGYTEDEIAAITDTLNQERVTDQQAFCENSMDAVQAVLDEF